MASCKLGTSLTFKKPVPGKRGRNKSQGLLPVRPAPGRQARQAEPTDGMAEGGHSSLLPALPRQTQHGLTCRQASAAWGLGLERQHLISPPQPGWNESWPMDMTEAVWYCMSFSWVLSCSQFTSPALHFYQHLPTWLGDTQPFLHCSSLPGPLPNTFSSHIEKQFLNCQMHLALAMPSCSLHNQQEKGFMITS